MAMFSTTYILMFAATMVVLVLGVLMISFREIKKRSYYLLLTVSFGVTRILSIVYLYGFAGSAGTSDLTNIFGYQAEQVLGGGIPYLTFESHYSPYFPYLLSLPYALYSQPVSLLSVFVVFDLLTMIVAGLYVRETWSEEASFKFCWIYSFIPFTWLFITYWNQDEVVAAFFIVLSLRFVTRDKEMKAAATIAVGFLLTKFLIAVFFIPLFLVMKKPIRNGLAAIGLVLLGYLPFLIVGANILMPITAEVGYHAVGSNPWVLMEAFGVDFPMQLPHVVVLASLLVLACIYMLSDKLHNLRPEATIVLFSLVYMLMGKKSFSFYVPFFLVFLIIVFMRFCAKNQNRSLLVAGFLAYLVSFSFLYQSVIVFKSMQTLTVDWIIASMVYVVALTSQVLLIWLLVRESQHNSQFHYWRLDSFIKNLISAETHEP
ncbi:MAG: hypothetical protein ACP6KW_08220 [Candidatus Thorarchaeota archaeon]